MSSVSSPEQQKDASSRGIPSKIENIVQCYGDLVFDLCESILWSPANAQLAFRSILRAIRRNIASNDFRDNERSWVLRIACDKLRMLSDRHGRRLTASEQIQLDATPNPSARLKQFDSYFHRLMTEDQLLLLLRDKYGLPYPEIAAALGVPEGTLKVQRQQALRTLEEWLWRDHRP